MIFPEIKSSGKSTNACNKQCKGFQKLVSQNANVKKKKEFRLDFSNGTSFLIIIIIDYSENAIFIFISKCLIVNRILCSVTPKFVI